MNTRTFLILGGYGETGRRLARLLLQETDVRLVLAGRSNEKAERAAARLNDAYEGNRATGVRADVAETESLEQLFAGVDFVLVASSTVRYARQVATAALAAGVDYLDIQISRQKLAVLQSLTGEILNAGRCFITEAGFHPGLPAALVRFVSQHFDRLDVANVSSVIKVNWSELSLSQSTIEEFVGEILEYETLFYKDGAWQKARMAGMLDYRTVDFGAEFGRQYAVPMMLEEMRAIPEMLPTIKETGFYVGGFNWFVDWLALPLIMVALRIWPRGALKPAAWLMSRGLETFSSPPYGVVLKVEASGEKDGQAREVQVSLSHEDGYTFTAIPVVACLLQYLDGSANRPGLWMMGHLVDPDRMMKDMERMGVRVA